MSDALPTIPGVSPSYLRRVVRTPASKAFRLAVERGLLGAMMTRDRALAGRLAPVLRLLADRDRENLVPTSGECSGDGETVN